MSCDIDYRYRRALYPEALVTFDTCLLAVTDAVADSRLAGFDPGSDPAVQLLTRRLSRLTGGTLEADHPEDQPLRERCLERLAELKHKPAIVSLVLRGVDHRPEELRHYQREGQRALRQVATAIRLTRADYQLNYFAYSRKRAGDHTLEGPCIHLRLSPQRLGEPGLAWRRPDWTQPGNAMRKAHITVLRDIPAFAARLARDLQLPDPGQGTLI
jgi:hypothetical protein